MARRPGCNPRGWGNCSSCWERGGGRVSRKSCVGGGGAGRSKDSLQICKQSDFAVFACWMCLLKPFLDCARYSLAVWVKMCGLQILLHTKWSFTLVKGTTCKLFKHRREFHYFILITRSAYFYLHLSFPLLYLATFEVISYPYTLIFRVFLQNSHFFIFSTAGFYSNNRRMYAIKIAEEVIEVKALQLLLLQLALVILKVFRKSGIVKPVVKLYTVSC